MSTNSGGYLEEAMEECLHKEVLDSIKEHLWFKQPSAQPEAEQKQLPADPSWHDSCTEFAAANCSMYEKFATMKWDLYEEMIA